MSTKQTNPTAIEDSNPIAEKVNRLLDSLDETDEKAMSRIDVLEDMLDILNER